MVLHLLLPDGHALDRVGNQGFEAGKIECRAEVGDRPSHVGGNQIEHRFRARIHAPDAQVAAQNQDGNVDIGDDIVEVIVGERELQVAVPQLFIQCRQFLIGGLQFLFRRFQLFIGALQFLVIRLDLLIGGLQLFIVRGKLLDHVLQLGLVLVKLLSERQNSLARPASFSPADGPARRFGGRQSRETTRGNGGG